MLSELVVKELSSFGEIETIMANCRNANPGSDIKRNYPCKLELVIQSIYLKNKDDNFCHLLANFWQWGLPAVSFFPFRHNCQRIVFYASDFPGFLRFDEGKLTIDGIKSRQL